MAVLSEREVEWILFLANSYETGEKYVALNSLPGFDQLEQNQWFTTLERLENFGFVKWQSQATLAIEPRIIEAAHQIKNPPPRDRPKELETWFRDQWWSVPLIVGGIGIPILWKWGEIVAWLLRVCGIAG